MNFLIVPLMIVGLLYSPAQEAGECVSEPRLDSACVDCAIKVKAGAADAAGDMTRQARKHAAFYQVLVRAQRAGALQAETRQYTAQSAEYSFEPTDIASSNQP